MEMGAEKEALMVFFEQKKNKGNVIDFDYLERLVADFELMMTMMMMMTKMMKMLMLMLMVPILRLRLMPMPMPMSVPLQPQLIMMMMMPMPMPMPVPVPTFHCKYSQIVSLVADLTLRHHSYYCYVAVRKPQLKAGVQVRVQEME